MALFYWVGGTNVWDSTYAGKWSTTSGGAANHTRAPTLGDAVYIDANSGNCNITPNGFTVSTLDFTGFIGGFIGTGNSKLQANGAGPYLKLNPTMNYSHTGRLTLDGSAAGNTLSVDFAGQVKKGGEILINSTGSANGTISLQSDLKNVGIITHAANAILNTNNFDIACNTYSPASGATLNLGTSKIQIDGYGNAWFANAGFNFTSSVGSEIRMMNSKNFLKTFYGAGKNYGNTVLVFHLNSVASEISGSNTIGLRTFGVNELGKLNLPASVTQTLTSWDVNGRAAGTVLVSPTFMTYNNAPSPYVITASEYQPPYAIFRAFDGKTNTFAHSLNALTTEPWTVHIDLGSSTHVGSYVLQARPDAVNHSFKDWTLQGSNDNSSWTTCDTRVNETVMTALERRTYICASPGTFRYWRWVVTASSGTHAEIGGLELYGTITDQYVDMVSTLAGTQASLVSSAPVNSDYISVKDNAASGNTFTAGSNSINNGNNTGWTFIPPPSKDTRAIIMA